VTSTDREHATTHRQIRGSSLLLAGRMAAILINLAVQVLIVRYLSKTEFGAFAYALSLVSIVETISTLGLDRAVGRFVPIYHEEDDVPRLFGTIVTMVLTILTVGTAAVVVILGARDLIVGPDTSGARDAGALLVILIILGPIQALDHVLEGLLAAFANARAIVLRRHIMAPLLKLLAIGGVIAVAGDARLLAILYVVAGAAGVALYAPLLIGSLRSAGLLGRIGWREIVLPVGALVGFAGPLLANDLALTVRTSLDAVFVQQFHGAPEVAVLRSVLPVARLNQLVFTSFALLFTPMAARLFARRDNAALDDLYWQTAVWQAIVSFPVFAVTFALAGAVTAILFGADYAAAAPVLAILSVGYYVNAATGQNSLTLRVFGRVRVLVVGALVITALTLLVDLLLIPPLGAVGAALASAAALVGGNIYNQVAMHRTTSVHGFRMRYLPLYAGIGVAGAALLALELIVHPPDVIAFAAAVAASIAVVVAFRSHLRLASTFPELARVPILRRLVR
jgi:O-antigen/teichoic acid export membrane protein